jgi:hypothetical protein
MSCYCKYFNICELFKTYIQSLDNDIYMSFKQLCLGNFTVDEYVEILKDCIENNTLHTYATIYWESKTSYEDYRNYKYSSSIDKNIYVNNIRYKDGIYNYNAPKYHERNLLVNYNYALELLDTAYYHTSNIIDDKISLISYSETIGSIERVYHFTFDNLLKNGGFVFLILPSCSKNKKHETLREFYKAQYDIDIYDNEFICSLCKLCNGWYKFFIKSISLLPERKIMTLYKKNKQLIYKTNINNTDDKPINYKQIHLTMRYEKE